MAQLPQPHSKQPPLTPTLRRIWHKIFAKPQHKKYTQPTKPPQTPTSLTHLPTELVLTIIHHLPPSSKLSLSHTSRRFSRTFPTSPHTLLKECQNSKPNPPSPSDWLTYLCILERSARPPKKLVCSTCTRRHPRTLFSLYALTQEPHKRQCIGHEGRLWLCPHKVWSFHECARLQKLQHDHHNIPGRLLLDNGLECFNDTCQCFDRVIISGVRVKMWRPPMVTARGAGGTMQDALRGVKFPICVHSPRTAYSRGSNERFPRPESFLAWFRRRRHRGWIFQCDVCGITTCVETDVSVNDRLRITEWVERRIPRFEGVTDPAWIAQVALKEDVVALFEEWMRCVGLRLDVANRASSRASWT